MSEPVDLSGLDFAVDMMRRPGPKSIAEQLSVVTTDRDIKAANLQLLVDKVLAYDGLDDHASVEDAVLAYAGMIELARSLKQ